MLLRDMKARYMFREFKGKINHVLFIELKLYGISKCAMLQMKKGKVQSEGIELPNGEKKINRC